LFGFIFPIYILGAGGADNIYNIKPLYGPSIHTRFRIKGKEEYSEKTMKQAKKIYEARRSRNE